MTTDHRWNPRYVAYCHAHGTPDPDAMLARDRERWPGGCMTGFLLWNGARWTEWRKIQGYDLDTPLGPYDYASFDLWLWGGVAWGIFPREGHA